MEFSPQRLSNEKQSIGMSDCGDTLAFRVFNTPSMIGHKPMYMM